MTFGKNLLPAASARHPTLSGLHDWWNGRRGELGHVPNRTDFDPAARPRLLPIVWMLDVHPLTLRFRFRLVGTAICHALQRDPTGELLDQSPSLSEAWVEACGGYRDVVLTGEPSWRKGPPHFTHDPRFDLVETLSLPFAAEGREVDRLLNASVFYRQDGAPLLCAPRCLGPMT